MTRKEKISNGYSICFNEWALDVSIKSELGLLLIISGLCAEKGYCYATNDYFSELFEVDEVTISRKIKKLEEKTYITVDYKMNGSVVEKREIRLTKMLTAINKNVNGAVNKNVKDNNTRENNTNEEKSHLKIYSEYEYKMMADKLRDLLKKNKEEWENIVEAINISVPELLIRFLKYWSIEKERDINFSKETFKKGVETSFYQWFDISKGKEMTKLEAKTEIGGNEKFESVKRLLDWEVVGDDKIELLRLSGMYEMKDWIEVSKKFKVLGDKNMDKLRLIIKNIK